MALIGHKINCYCCDTDTSNIELTEDEKKILSKSMVVPVDVVDRIDSQLFINSPIMNE